MRSAVFAAVTGNGIRISFAVEGFFPFCDGVYHSSPRWLDCGEEWGRGNGLRERATRANPTLRISQRSEEIPHVGSERFFG